MSVDEKSVHANKFDGHFPKLVATNEKPLSPYRMRDGRDDDWSPFDEPPLPDQPVLERPIQPAALPTGADSARNAGWLSGLGARLGRLRLERQRKRARTRTLEVLRSLDDHLLQDIGFLRSELRE